MCDKLRFHSSQNTIDLQVIHAYTPWNYIVQLIANV